MLKLPDSNMCTGVVSQCIPCEVGTSAGELAAIRVRFTIYCAMQSPQSEPWTEWAKKWLSGEDRSGAAAEVAADEAWEPAAAWVWNTVARAAARAAALAWSAADMVEAAATIARSAWTELLASGKVTDDILGELALRAWNDEVSMRQV